MKIARQRRAAQNFVKQWSGERKELGQDEQFWTCLLRDVYGVKKPEEVIDFKVSVPGYKESTKFLDGYILPSKTLIEQKAWGKDLDKEYSQSDGTMKTPFQQARRYSERLPFSKKPRWIIVSNFEEFRLHDMEQPDLPPTVIKLSELPEKASYFNFLVNDKLQVPDLLTEISVKAGDAIGELYDALLKQYKDPDSPKTLENLNVLCVRLVFLLYAQAAGLLGEDKPFNRYLLESRNTRKALQELFDVLDTPYDQRSPYIEDDPILAEMPYINGGLFANKDIEIPSFPPEIKDLLIQKTTIDFSQISPTIFGAIFESVSDPDRRRTGGVHFTSLENIHKVINPLFLDNLRDELNEILNARGRFRTNEDGEKIWIPRETLLQEFQDKLSKIVIFDPAAGSGNFLTESYIQLRRLENAALARMNKDNMVLNVENPIKVSIGQFYGIEINDFAVSVARTALWIAEAQLLEETQAMLMMDDIDFFPLKSYPNIVEGNALTMDWNDVVSNQEATYIIGNPPFFGTRMMLPEQKAELAAVFEGWKGSGNFDYVTCWFKKASDFIKGTDIRCALVATNSICQGEQIAPLWEPLIENGVHIDFAYQTFVWNSEAIDKAHVHCVIIGFSRAPNPKMKLLFTPDGTKMVAHINPYLINGPDVFVKKSSFPLSKQPEMRVGGDAKDGGNLVLTEAEKNALLKAEPQAAPFIRPYVMGKDFIDRKPRYCLWLVDADPSLLKKCPQVLKRIQKTKEFRQTCSSPDTKKKADTPMLFTMPQECHSDYIAIPRVSSKNRKYIPIDYLPAEVIPGNCIYTIQSSSLYRFGVLNSIVHMAWMRRFAGRLKSDYRYSSTFVYNTFPWPEPTNEQKEEIERTAQAILDARKLYPNASLADLYDEKTMPAALRKAHEDNDMAVLRAYGFRKKQDEPEIVSKLLNLYKKIDAA